MKKWLTMLMAMLMMLTVVSAYAAVPSKTTADMTQTQDVTSASGAELPDTVVVEVVKNDEKVEAEIAELYTFVNNPAASKAPIEYFPVEVQMNVQEHLTAMGVPEDYDIKQMEINEFVAIDEFGYEEQYGDIVARFSFATKYAKGTKLVGLLGIYGNEMDANGNYLVEWMVVEAEALEDGSVALVLPQELMLRIQAASSTALAVLNEPMKQ